MTGSPEHGDASDESVSHIQAALEISKVAFRETVIGPNGEVAPWDHFALCAQVDPNLFYPEKGGSLSQAKRVCKECPVRRECLEYALEADEEYGIWGGKTRPERLKLKRG